MKLVWGALSAFSLGACSLIYTGDGLVGPGPDAGGGDAIAEGGASDAGDDALDEKAPVVVDGQIGIGGIAIDATFLYWTLESGKVMRRNREGVAKDEEIASGESKPGAIAVDATHVYWTATLAVRRRALSGGSAEQFAITAEDPNGLAIDRALAESTVYWTETNGGVLKTKTSAGENVFASKLDRPSALTFSSKKLYVVLAAGNLHTTGFGGGINTQLPEIEGRRITSIAGTSLALYFASDSNKSLGRFNALATDERVTPVLQNTTSPSLASDGGFLYFVDETRGRIRRLTL